MRAKDADGKAIEFKRNLTTARWTFIIDKNGVIQYAESNDDARQLPNFEKIKVKLEELK